MPIYNGDDLVVLSGIKKGYFGDTVVYTPPTWHTVWTGNMESKYGERYKSVYTLKHKIFRVTCGLYEGGTSFGNVITRYVDDRIVSEFPSMPYASKLRQNGNVFGIRNHSRKTIEEGESVHWLELSGKTLILGRDSANWPGGDVEPNITITKVEEFY